MIAAWGLLIVALLITVADIFTFLKNRAELKEDHDFRLVEADIKKWLGQKRIVDRLPRLLKQYSNGSADAKSELQSLPSKLGQEGFMNEFLNILKKLDYPYYAHFWEILRSAGIEIRPASISEEDEFIVEWKEGSKISDLWIEIPDEWKSLLREPIESLCYWLYRHYELEGIDLEQIVSHYDMRFEGC